MSGKLKDYEVLDVLCGGTYYRVRHKVTDDIFAWKAYDCSAYSAEQIQSVVSDVKAISAAAAGAGTVLRYRDTVLHAASRTLYLVADLGDARSLSELRAPSGRRLAEPFVWRLLLELARACEIVAPLRLAALRKCISPASVFVTECCELRVDCFELAPAHTRPPELLAQAGAAARALCGAGPLPYSADLRDVLSLMEGTRRGTALRPAAVRRHPALLAGLEAHAAPTRLGEILLPVLDAQLTSQVNKCDSEKAVELCKTIRPRPRTRLTTCTSPIYSNVSPGRRVNKGGPLSPTLVALALELPGFVPRTRKLSRRVAAGCDPQLVSEETLSHEWMARLVALRQREEILNKRERDLISKEIVNSPSAKIIPLDEASSPSMEGAADTNGITLPPVIIRAGRRARRRRRPRACSYEELDSSLSGDAGDDAGIVTAAKLAGGNVPHRNIFPEISMSKVHFTSSNLFIESDENIALTFYELGSAAGEGGQGKAVEDISKFKYLDLEKVTSEKRAAVQNWGAASLSKQPRVASDAFTDITNTGMITGLRKTPSKSSLASKSVASSRCSVASLTGQWSSESGGGAPLREEVKKSKRRSLLPFKTPFKFMTATKI